MNDHILATLDQHPSGARFHRVDLHVHTYGGSYDVADPTATPEAVIGTAVREHLAAIAVTDHNNIGNVGAACRAAESGGLLNVPGVELSTPDGHLLAYFRSLELLERFFGRLDIAGRGTSESRCQTGMVQCLELIDPRDGFAILAHVDGPGGFDVCEPRMTPHKVDVLIHRSLLGIELRSSSSEISYGDSDPEAARASIARKRRETLQLGERQCLARVLFSDAHTLDALGRNAAGNRRVSRFKMDQPTFDGLRIALLESDARVRIEDEIPEAIPYIRGVIMAGGFLDGTGIHFSPNLNILIGGRGAGKSTALEASRCIASDLGDPSTLVDSEAWPDDLRVVWRDEAGKDHLISRTKGGELRNDEDPDFGPTTFPIECHGQGEMARTSTLARSEPLALLTYLDQFVDLGERPAQDDDLRAKLLQNQEEIRNAEGHIARIPCTEQTLKSVQQQLRALEEAKGRELIGLERSLARERTLRDNVRESLRSLGSAVSSPAIAEALKQLRAITKPADLSIGGSAFQRILDSTTAFSSSIAVPRQGIESAFQALLRDATLALNEWNTADNTARGNLAKKKTELQAQGVKLDVSYITKLADSEASLAKTLDALRTWVPHLATLRRGRTQLLQDRQRVREEIAARRVAFGRRASSELRGTLGDLAISVKFRTSALSPEAKTIIQDAMGWRTSQVPRADILVFGITLPLLLGAIHRRDPNAIAGYTTADGMRSFTRQDALAIIDRLREPQHLHALEQCDVQDFPVLTATKLVPDLNAGPPRAVSREFAHLSLGQQQSVLLALLLASQSTVPLLIDQPEDHLDGEFIYAFLVPALRRIKERRQVIIVTHNANLAVLTDAEQVVALKSTSDRGAIVARGSVDSDVVAEFVGRILEGSREAFLRRGKLYGLIG